MFAGHIFSYKMKMSLVRQGEKDIFLIECDWEESIAKFKPLYCQYLYIFMKQQQRNCFLIFYHEIRWKLIQKVGGLNTGLTRLNPSLSTRYFLPCNYLCPPPSYRETWHIVGVNTPGFNPGFPTYWHIWCQFPHLENPCPHPHTELSKEQTR